MSLRIAFDLDGTLADLDSALEAITQELYPHERADSQAGEQPNGGATRGPESGPARTLARDAAAPRGSAATDSDTVTAEEEQLEPPQVRALTRREQHEIWATVRRTSNFWETLGETEPGIVARIAAVAGERRWEVLFITQRPASDGDTTQRQTQRWLATHGFDMPSVYVLGAGASRGKVASVLSLDVVVDDRAENCVDVKLDSGARAFLVCREPTPKIIANAKRLGIEVVASINQCLDMLEAASPEKPGLMGRLKKIIGV